VSFYLQLFGVITSSENDCNGEFLMIPEPSHLPQYSHNSCPQNTSISPSPSHRSHTLNSVSDSISSFISLVILIRG